MSHLSDDDWFDWRDPDLAGSTAASAGAGRKDTETPSRRHLEAPTGYGLDRYHTLTGRRNDGDSRSMPDACYMVGHYATRRWWHSRAGSAWDMGPCIDEEFIGIRVVCPVAHRRKRDAATKQVRSNRRYMQMGTLATELQKISSTSQSHAESSGGVPFQVLVPAINALRGSNKILLFVGGASSVVPQQLRDHPRIEHWECAETGTTLTKTVPDRVGAIAFNRWVGHKVTARLRAESRRLGIPMVSIPILPRDVVTILEKATATETETSKGPIQPGRLMAFLSEHADFGPRRMGTDDFNRLLAMAQAKGIPTTYSSLSSTYYVMRRRQREAVEAHADAPVTPPTPPAPPVTPPTPPAPPAPPAPPVTPPLTPAQAPPIAVAMAAGQAGDVVPVTFLPPPPDVVAPTAQSQNTPDVASVIRLIDDAQAALGLVREALTSFEPTIREAIALRSKLDAVRDLIKV